MGARTTRRREFGTVGSAELHEDRCVIKKRGSSKAVLSRDLRGFRDEGLEHIELVHERSSIFGDWMLTIPTLTEKDRVAVLEFLDQRGVRRLG